MIRVAGYDTPGRRLFLLAWNVLGLFDILMVLAIAAQTALADPGFRHAFATLPLSLLPTFVVPLVIASHALIFVWARRVPAGASARVEA